MNYAIAIKYLFKDIKHDEFRIKNDNGTFSIINWTYPSVPPTIEQLDEVYDAAILADAQQKKIVELKVQLDIHTSKTISISTKKYKADAASIELMRSIVEEYAHLTNKDENGNINWWLADTIGKVNDTDLTAAIVEYSIRAAIAIDNAAALLEQINLATNVAAVDAIDITAGWPD